MENINIWSCLYDNKKFWSHKTETLKFWRAVGDSKKFLVYDTETTGLKKTVDRIIEFSAMVLEKVGAVYEQIDQLELFINPGFMMDADCIAVHHITNEFLNDKPFEYEAFNTIKAFIEKHEGAVVMGYNVKFDNGFFAEMCKRNDYQYPFSDDRMVDVFALVKENIHQDEHQGYRKLSDITKLLCPASDFVFHNSSEDIRATWKVGVEILKKYVSTSPVLENQKPACKIVSYNTKNFGRGNKFVFVTLKVGNSFHDVYYNVKQNCWVNKTGDDVFNCVNMEAVESVLNNLAQKQGKSGFHLLAGSQKL